MDSKEARRLFEAVDAVRTGGHFRLSSHLHSSVYVQKEAVSWYTNTMMTLCSALAEKLKDADIDAVIGPATGAIAPAAVVASELTTMRGQEVFFGYADKTELGYFNLRPYVVNRIRGLKVLLVEDVLTTGGSARLVIETVHTRGGIVTHAAALWNRGGVTAAQLGVKRLTALCNDQLDSWDTTKEKCPLCARGIPIDGNIGHSKARQHA